MLTHDDYKLIYHITLRAEAMNIRLHSRMTHTLDIEHAVEQFHMRLTDWLNADDFNFAHDFIGITLHINR